MSDLGTVLPDCHFQNYDALLQTLEDSRITTSDLLSIDAIELAQRTKTPLVQVRGLVDQVRQQLHAQVFSTAKILGEAIPKSTGRIKLLDHALDAALGDGLRPGYITEIVGPSGVGKTQFLLSILLSAQLEVPLGLARPTLYISTEHNLPTQRLTGILTANATLAAAVPRPSLSKILTLHAPDLETQDHVLQFQLPVVLARHKIGLVVIDSIAANYRAEEIQYAKTESRGPSNSARFLSQRSAQLIHLGALLRDLARRHNCAVVVANQVADRMEPVYTSNLDIASSGGQASSPRGPPSSFGSSQNGQTRDNLISASTPQVLPYSVMNLEHQQRWFTGWGDERPSGHGYDIQDGVTLKTPTLGMVWTNQIACRIALHRSPASTAATVALPPHHDKQDKSAQGVDHRSSLGGADWSKRRWQRRLRLVFAPWATGCDEDDTGAKYEIWAGGLRSCSE